MSNYIKFLYQAGLLSTITLMGANCGGSGNNKELSDPEPIIKLYEGLINGCQEVVKLSIVRRKPEIEEQLNLSLDSSNQRDTEFKDACLKTFDKSTDQLFMEPEQSTTKDDVAKSQKIDESFEETIKKSVKESMYKQGYTEQKVSGPAR